MASIIKSGNSNARKPYTVRYRDSFGKQKERSFTTRKEASAFVTDQDKARRYGHDVDLSAAKESFNDAVEAYLKRLPAGRTTDNYWSAYRAHIKAAYKDHSVLQAARDKAKLDQLINVTMSGLCSVGRSRVRTLVVRTLNDLVGGPIDSHRLGSVELRKLDYVSPRPTHDEFQFVSREDAEWLAQRCGVWVTLQRRLGLRISEALGLHREDFQVQSDGRVVLHLTRQVARDSQRRVALKAKDLRSFRDVPVPVDVWAVVRDMPDGPLCPGRKNTYYSYSAAKARFLKESEKIGFKSLGTHQLRHSFATDLFRRNANLVMISKLLGHADVAVTSRVYVHLLPSDLDSAAGFMD